MAWILYSGSLLMKQQSDKIQWYYDKLQPYVNYIPVSADFSNLQQQFEWAQTHQEQVQIIARQGRQLAQEVFTKENILNALEEAFNEYHKLVEY